MRIGALADAVGLSVDTIRCDEREGLLERPARTPGGPRDYGGGAVGQLRAVARAKALGFTLAETAALLRLGREPDTDAGEVRAFAAQRLAETEAALAGLARQRDALAALVAACGGGAVARRDGPVLSEVRGPPDATPGTLEPGPGRRPGPLLPSP